ncbi:MAG: recombinase family protein [Pirellulaceae bacterium]|nr:recombinase family protein [Pirellulaceae bacterium]
MSSRNKKVRKTREDIQREQQALLEKTEREIDEIVAEFHNKLPREKAEAIGALYARFSSRFQDSIADQIRTLYEAAVAEGIFVPRELIFFDLAVRGWKDRRPGLTALRAAIERKAFQVFLVFTTSRLFRRTYKALQFVEEELVERGIRGVFLKSGLDTSDGENWRTTFQLFAAMDEAMVRTYGSHVQAAHEGLFRRGLVFGSLPLGFTGEEVPGEFTKRKRPRRRIIVDPETAPWIEKIFDIYVVSAKSLAAIAQELNDDADAPAPNKSLTGLWTPVLVRNHLMNAAYRGFLCYGAKQTKWLSEKDYAKQVPRDEPLKSGQFENLRIVSDEHWYRAQQLLANERGNSGRKSSDGDRQSRPRLLRGLFVCPKHERQLVVSGPYEARAEAVQDVVVSAMLAYVRLCERGKSELAYPSVLARYAVAQYRAGRRVAERMNCCDVLSPYARRMKDIRVESINDCDRDEEPWRNRHAGPAEIAATRIDVADWFASLTHRNHKIAEALSDGSTTRDVAKRFRLSAGRISQKRRELLESWQEFQGEQDEPAEADRVMPLS